MLYKEEETQLVFMAQLKAYNVIPLHLECAKTKQKKRKNKQQQQNYNQKKKKLNAKILITRPRVQDEQFDTILTEIITCFTLWPMHKLSRLMASIFFFFFFLKCHPPPFWISAPLFTYPGSVPDCRLTIDGALLPFLNSPN